MVFIGDDFRHEKSISCSFGGDTIEKYTVINIDKYSVLHEQLTPEFQSDVIIVYPLQLDDERFIKNDLSHLITDLKELILKREKFFKDCEELSNIENLEERKTQMLLVKTDEQMIDCIKDRINNGVLPLYKWMIYTNYNDYFHPLGRIIKTDYLLYLRDLRKENT